MKAHQTLALTALIVGCSVPAFAQAPATRPSAPAEVTPNLRFQVRTMETVLTSAVQNGVDRLAQKINEVAPGLRLFAGLPHAHGYQLENMGWFFDVEVPDIYPGSADLYVELLPTSPVAGANGVGRPVSNSGTVSAAARPEVMAPAVVRDPRGEYRTAIREALIDAMLDFGQMPLKPSESLTIGARRPDPVGPAVAGDESVTLVLSIKGEDLTALRAGKITRAEAKARIKIRDDRR